MTATFITIGILACIIWVVFWCTRLPPFDEDRLGKVTRMRVEQGYSSGDIFARADMYKKKGWRLEARNAREVAKALRKLERDNA